MTNDKVVKVATYILVAILAIAAIGLIVTITGGSDGGFQSFYVTVNGENILTSAGGYLISPENPLRIETKCVLPTDEAVAGKYTVKVLPNTSIEEDFDFMLNGAPYSFKEEKDLTQGFVIEKGDGYFTIAPKGDTLTKVIQAVYPDDTVEAPEEAICLDMFTMIITNPDLGTTIEIFFALPTEVTGVILDKEVIEI